MIYEIYQALRILNNYGLLTKDQELLLREAQENKSWEQMTTKEIIEREG